MAYPEAVFLYDVPKPKRQIEGNHTTSACLSTACSIDVELDTEVQEREQGQVTVTD